MTPAAGRPVLALVTTLSVQVMATVALTAPSVMAPVVAPLLEMPPQRIGWFVGLAYLVAMLSGLLAGAHAARSGPIRLSSVALLCCAAGLLLAAAAPLPGGTLLLPLAAIAIGAGYGLPNPTASMVLARHAPPHRRGLFFSIKQTGVPAGVGLAGLLVPPLLATMPWPAALLVLAAACAVHALMLHGARALDAPAHGTDEAAARPAAPSLARALVDPMRHVWRAPALRRLALVSMAYSMTQLAFVTFLVSYLALERGHGLVAAAAALSSSQLVAVVCRVLWGQVADRWIRPSRLLGLLGIAMGAAVFGLATIPASGVPGATLAIVIACAATAVAWNGVFYAELAARVRPDEIATATGGVQVVTFAGAMTGPVMFAIAVSTLGSHASAYLLQAVLPVAAGVWMLASADR